MRPPVKLFLPWTVGLAVLFGVAGLAVPPASVAAPNTGSAPQKTEKQCKSDRTKCNKDCDQLIDIGDNIKRCKDRCTDAWILCLPARTPGQPGGVVPPVTPGTNAPIQRRGIEGEQPAPSPTVPEEKGGQAP